ncbi:hypothetical protein C9374_006413 [Naegleria lovaniensis]|uniref:Protein RER1 n=1 Tax=Naegleria lovaniensis TaxID=51637 RepID=A0AA88KH62_NAELO|nr:uncharacterized protein C9374_006413 [Naegleria lovaniensis]KAG2381424.1 hypothetical protein C9374_006413 [Naegleria lovaniensis]
MDLESESSSGGSTFRTYSMKYQAFLDRLNGKVALRWTVLGVLFSLFLFRVLYFHGWYIVTYGFGIYVINLFIAFITPKFRPQETEEEDDEENSLNATLPNTSVGRNFSAGGMFGQPKVDPDDVKPFVRRLPEFKFWYSLTKAIIICLLLTSTRVLDIPVYWPILLGYWILLLAITLRKQIRDMIKHKYVPFTIGKKSYGNSGSSVFGSALSGFVKPSPGGTTSTTAFNRTPQFGSYQSAFQQYTPTMNNPLLSQQATFSAVSTHGNANQKLAD